MVLYSNWEEETPERTITALFSVPMCVYIWKSNEISVTQEIELDLWVGAGRGQIPGHYKEMSSSIVRNRAAIQATDPGGINPLSSFSESPSASTCTEH